MLSSCLGCSSDVLFSQLQDIVCTNCAALLGLKCGQTPVNHVLDEYAIRDLLPSSFHSDIRLSETRFC